MIKTELIEKNRGVIGLVIMQEQWIYNCHVNAEITAV